MREVLGGIRKFKKDRVLRGVLRVDQKNQWSTIGGKRKKTLGRRRVPHYERHRIFREVLRTSTPSVELWCSGVCTLIRRLQVSHLSSFLRPRKDVH